MTFTGCVDSASDVDTYAITTPGPGLIRATCTAETGVATFGVGSAPNACNGVEITGGGSNVVVAAAAGATPGDTYIVTFKYIQT